MGKLKEQYNEEYETLFPFEQKYHAWIDSIEQDYRSESEYRSGITATSKAQFFFDDEDLSPYATINS